MSSNAFSAAAILLSAGVVVPLFFFVLITQVTTIGLKETDEPDNRHYFKVGVEPARSSLLNQNRAAHKPRPGQSPQLHSLWIYPLKSCRGIELARSRVLPTGLEFDRLYTFAQLRETDASKDLSAPSWEFLTQRQLPLLANVEVELWLPTPHAAASRKKANGGADADDGIIIVRFPWRRPGWTGLVQWIVTKFSRGFGAQPQKKFTLPVNFPSDEAIKADGYEYGNVRIWKEHTMALNLAKDVPPELHTYLGMPPGRPLGLFRMDPSKQREVFRCAPSKETAGYQPVVDFHDAYPLHLMSLNSLWDFEAKMPKDDKMLPLDVRRFRSNMIVSGAETYDEETWRKISFSHDFMGDEKSHFDVSCRTVRCKMLNVDQETGDRHKFEPDRSLRKFRDVDQGAPRWGCMGMQLCPLFPDAEDPNNRQSVLEVGMKLTVNETGSHVYIPQ